MKGRWLVAALATLLTIGGSAKAGGLDELPDQGAQALGRGAAFTAKADDATALYYNVAGIARQRGTKLQLGANVHFNEMSFQREGTYVDDASDPLTPWGGQKYPLVRDKNKSFTLPMVALTTDLGVFDRLTFGLGVWGPAATGRTFQLGIDGRPSPGRYDKVQSQSAVLFPTLGAAYRVTEHLDIGIAGHLALADLNEMSIAYADAGGGACKNPEYRPCDAEGRFKGSGVGAGASVGVLFRPDEAIQIGAQVRSPMSVNANGTTTAKIGASGKFGEPSVAGTRLDLPWVIRAGVRYIAMEKTKTVKRELFDVELDGTYETWGTAQELGPQVKTTDPLGGEGTTTITSLHKWNDTFSLRAGGAYNLALDDEAEDVVVFRAGTFYDSSATEPKYTRLDTNTLAKLGGTLGFGFRHGAWSANLAYAAVLSMSRTVTDGELRPNNGAKGGDNVDGEGNPLPVVNNGDYAAFSHVLSFSIEVNFEAFFRTRKPVFGDAEYEDLERAPEPEKPKNRAEQPPKKSNVEPPEPPGTWWNPRVPPEQLGDYKE